MENSRVGKEVTNATKVIKGMSSQTIVSLVLGVVEIVSFSIMSRLLSQKDFGYYAAIVAIGTIFQSIADAGIGSSIVQKKDISKRFVNNAFTMSIMFGVGASLLLCLLAELFAGYVADETMITPLRLFSITLFCHCIASINLSLLQRELKFLTIGIINLASLVITTLVAIILALKGLGYYAILTKTILASILTVILSWVAVKGKYNFAFDKEEYRRIFAFGGWLMASSIFRNLSHQADRLLMKSLFSIEALGFYTRPHEFIQNITSKVNQIFDSVLFPVLSSVQDSKERLRHSYENVLYYLNLGGVFLSLFFLFCHDLIIRIFFGSQWINVGSLFAVMSAWCVILINGRVGDVYLRSLAMTKTQFLLRVFQLISVTMFILMGYRWGLAAMAIASMAGYSLIVVIKSILIAKKIEMPVAKMFKCIMSSWRITLWFIPLYILNMQCLSATIGSSIIYACSFLIASIIIFLFFPQMVGRRYRDGIYNKARSVIISKIKK